MAKDILDAKRLGLAGGILWGAAMLLIGLTAMIGYGEAWLALMASVYKGYAASLVGAIVGGIYGFIDGFIGLYILAWIYNKLG